MADAAHPYVRRYTNLAATIHILRTKSLTLLDPKTWDDRNDSYFLEQYKTLRKAKSALALCFARATETYHHWRVFSAGSDGVCIEFDKKKLVKDLQKNGKIRSGPVEYARIRDLSSRKFDLRDLPFLKRQAFADEKEWRIIYTNLVEPHPTISAQISLGSINRIVVSPWMPKALVDVVKETLHDIPDCAKLSVYRSTLIENEVWKKYARKTAKRKAVAPAPKRKTKKK